MKHLLYGLVFGAAGSSGVWLLALPGIHGPDKFIGSLMVGFSTIAVLVITGNTKYD